MRLQQGHRKTSNRIMRWRPQSKRLEMCLSICMSQGNLAVCTKAVGTKAQDKTDDIYEQLNSVGTLCRSPQGTITVLFFVFLYLACCFIPWERVSNQRCEQPVVVGGVGDGETVQGVVTPPSGKPRPLTSFDTTLHTVSAATARYATPSAAPSNPPGPGGSPQPADVWNQHALLAAVLCSAKRNTHTVQ